MLLSRDELISALFRETDRAQRMKMALAVILCDIKGAKAWPGEPGAKALLAIERETTARIIRVLRCYDVAGRYEPGIFGLLLPGCNSFNAVGMAMRLRSNLIGFAPKVGGEEFPLEPCFGVAGSGGRSPLVVLRNAEHALQNAKSRGVGEIHRCSYDPELDSAAQLMPVTRD